MFKKTFLSCILAISIAACNASNKNITFEQMEDLRSEAYYELDKEVQKEKYKKLIHGLTVLAKEKNNDVQFILGDIYDRGLAGEVDKEKGFYWIKEAADNGNIDAILRTAINYQIGNGTKINPINAKKYYLGAANLNSPEAKGALGMIFIDEKDIHQGLFYLKQAAEKNNVLAQFKLGLIYCEGEIVEKDYQQCNGYWKKAADQGQRDSIFNYAVNMHQGFGEYNIDEAIKYYTIASVQGNGSASYNLHVIYNNPKYNRIDKVKASNYLKMAEEQGYNRPKAIMYIKEE